MTEKTGAPAPTEIEVAGVRLGGAPGLYPTMLVGSIFYDRHGIVGDARAGTFDREKAAALLALQDEWSARTGNPCMVDVVASSVTAIERYLDFVCSHTAVPVLVDGSSPDVRIAGARWAARNGVVDRVVYNSFSPESSAEEYSSVAETGCSAAILLTISSLDISLEGRMRTLAGPEGLVARARQAGIERLLVDPGVIDLPSVGVVREAMRRIHAEYGLVTGTAAHNAIGTWGGLKQGNWVPTCSRCSPPWSTP